MNTKDAKQLIKKYQTGDVTQEELALIEKWVLLGTVKDLDLSDKELAADFADLRGRLPLHYQSKQRKLWPRIAVAAAVLLIVGMGLFFGRNVLNRQAGEGRHQDAAAANYNNHDIPPGKNTATLLLANGKTINLSDAKSGVIVDASKLTYSDNTPIADKESLPSGRNDGKAVEMTLSTPRGGTYQITLADGTRVWLNAASSLTYSASLNQRGERRVSLNGEAYFEVAKDKRHPFVVKSEGQEVRVLGTHFNINAYKDEPGIKTTLLEGSVKVIAGALQAVIKPGQQSSLKRNGIDIEEVNVNNMIDWKNGKFRFKNEPLTSILRKVSRWYDIDIVYQSDTKHVPTFSGSVSRFDNVSVVLKMLEETSDVKFIIEGNAIRVQ